MDDTETRLRAGRKPTFGKEEVAAAANGLLADGQEVSVRAVRQRLGKGSLTTVGAMLREVMDEAEGPGGAGPAGPAPPVRIIAELKARLDQLGAELESERHGHDLTRAALEAGSKALEAERKALEAANMRIGALEAAASRASAERQKADREHDRAILAEDRLKDRTEQLELVRNQILDLQEYNGKLDDTIKKREWDISKLKKDFNEYQVRSQKERDEARLALVDRDGMVAKSKSYYNKAIQMEQHNYELQEKLKKMEQRCEEAETQLDDATKKLDKMKKRFESQSRNAPGPRTPRP